MKIIIVCIVFCISSLVLGQQNQTDYAKEIVSVLASDSLKGRPASSLFEMKAADYIIQKLKINKQFKPKRQVFTYQRKDSTGNRNATNIYCYLNNKADSTIVISAHYDHLGTGEGISRSFGKQGIHYGADDNASGVALLLLLANQYNSYKSKKFNYLFVSCSAHEIGLFGSEAFYRFCEKNSKPIALMLNFDMVGRYDNESKVLNIYGIKTLKKQTDFFNQVTFPGKIYTTENDKIEQSDCKWFVANNYKCLSFSTGIHDDYHKITDTADKINYEGIVLIENYCIKLLQSFANQAKND